MSTSPPALEPLDLELFDFDHEPTPVVDVRELFDSRQVFEAVFSGRSEPGREEPVEDLSCSPDILPPPSSRPIPLTRLRSTPPPPPRGDVPSVAPVSYPRPPSLPSLAERARSVGANPRRGLIPLVGALLMSALLVLVLSWTGAKAEREVASAVDQPGPFSFADAQVALERASAGLGRCELPMLPHPLVIEVTYAPDGRVARVSPVAPADLEPQVSACVTKQIARARVQAFVGGEQSLLHAIRFDAAF